MTDEFKAAYEKLLKENTRLHAEKTYIIGCATTNIKHADEEIKKLHSIINQNLDHACAIVGGLFPESETLKECQRQIRALKPLQIGASGEEKPTTGSNV